MCILLGKLVNSIRFKMLTRTKFFLFLIVLQCPPSLMIPLAQQDVSSLANTNDLVELEPNQIELINPNNSVATDLLQQIDIKDNANQVISNINHVVVSDEDILQDSNITLSNLLEQNGNVSVVNNTGVTNPFNASSSVLLSELLNDTSRIAGNTTIPGLQYNLANETQTNPLNTTNNLNPNNATIHEVSTIQNGSITNINVSSTTGPYISGGTTIRIGTENVTRLNNNISSALNYEETGVPTLLTIDGEYILHESLNDTEVELAWRSDVPTRKNKDVKKLNAKLKPQNVTLRDDTINSSVNNDNSNLLDSEIDDDSNIFVILNSGNIDDLSVNSPASSGHLETNLKNNGIENQNSNNLKLLNDIINTTITDVLSKILQQNSKLNSTHIFLLLNSGSISNVHVSSPVLENIVKNTTLKDRSRRHLNNAVKNNTDIESETLKPSTKTTNSSIDIKFRTGEHVTNIPLDNHQTNSTLGSEASDNSTLINSNSTVVDLTKDEEISNSEAPAFRSLIPDKIKKLQQVSNLLNNVSKQPKDHNLVLNISPETPPISIDLNQLPINNILDGALTFIKRLKRNTYDIAENSKKTNCKSKQIDEYHTVKLCKKSKSNNNVLNTLNTRKSLDNNSTVLKLDSVELVCPLSVIVKLYTHQVLENLSKNNSDSLLNNILSSFLNGNEDAINLASKELSALPIPVKIRLQIVHGETKEFMKQLSNIVDATLCSLS